MTDYLLLKWTRSKVLSGEGRWKRRSSQRKCKVVRPPGPPHTRSAPAVQSIGGQITIFFAVPSVDSALPFDISIRSQKVFDSNALRDRVPCMFLNVFFL